MQPFFHLKGSTLVLIDWANLFHSQEKSGWKINIQKLHRFIVSHPEAKDAVLFHGIDDH